MDFRKPYKLHRQQHLAELFEELSERGILAWSVDLQRRTVAWTIAETGKAQKQLGTKGAEAVAQGLANAERIVWIPVGGKGGKEEYLEVAARIEAMKGGDELKPWE